MLLLIKFNVQIITSVLKHEQEMKKSKVENVK